MKTIVALILTAITCTLGLALYKEETAGTYIPEPGPYSNVAADSIEVLVAIEEDPSVAPEGYTSITIALSFNNISSISTPSLRATLRFSTEVYDYLELTKVPTLTFMVESLGPKEVRCLTREIIIPELNGDPLDMASLEAILSAPVMVQICYYDSVEYLLATPTVRLETSAKVAKLQTSVTNLGINSDSLLFTNAGRDKVAFVIEEAGSKVVALFDLLEDQMLAKVKAANPQVLGWYGENLLVSLDTSNSMSLELLTLDGEREHLGIEDLPVALDRPIWSQAGRYVAYSGPESCVVVIDVEKGVTQFIANAINPEWTPQGLHVTYQNVGRVLPIR